MVSRIPMGRATKIHLTTRFQKSTSQLRPVVVWKAVVVGRKRSSVVLLSGLFGMCTKPVQKIVAI